MGISPIIEKSNSEEIPTDGRISLGEDYAHKRVPLEICVPTDDEELTEHTQYNYTFYTVRKFEADSRGRVTLPAPVRENHNEVFWAISEPAFEYGGLAEAYEELKHPTD